MMIHKPLHPGPAVLEGCIEPLGLNISEAARKLGISRHRLSKIVRSKSRITPDMAIRIEKAFGGGAEMWYRVQSDYDLAQVRSNGVADAIAESMPSK